MGKRRSIPFTCARRTHVLPLTIPTHGPRYGGDLGQVTTIDGQRHGRKQGSPAQQVLLEAF